MKSRCLRASKATTVALWCAVAIVLLFYGGTVTEYSQSLNSLPVAETRFLESAPSVPEVRRIVYIRIPKTGSSTITLLVWRFAWTRNLSVLAVNPKYEGMRRQLTPKMFFLPPADEKYDVMAEHVVYNKTSFSEHLSNDAVYTTMLREPFSMLYSSLYYLPPFQRMILDKNKVEAYLKNPAKYDDAGNYADRSYTKNPQASFLGLRKEDAKNETKVKELIYALDRTFPVIMILERLDESLVLLRRVLKWPMKDIIYAVQNVNSKKPKLKFSHEQREKYKSWSMADHQLYDFFSQKLEKQIQDGGPELQVELALYRKYRADVTRYCRFQTIMDEDLWFPKTDYNAMFSVTRKDCAIISVEPLVLISNIRKRQHKSPYLSPSL